MDSRATLEAHDDRVNAAHARIIARDLFTSPAFSSRFRR
jgi:hypothetical protein